MSATLELQKSIYAILSVDSGLLARVTGVYDSVPQNAVAPYVYFADVETVDISGLAKKKYHVTFEINSISESLGKKDSAEIAEIVRGLLDGKKPTIAAYENANIRFVSQSIAVASDGKTYIAKQKYEGVITKS